MNEQKEKPLIVIMEKVPLNSRLRVGALVELNTEQRIDLLKAGYEFRVHESNVTTHIKKPKKPFELPPAEICAAAIKVDQWFKKNGCESWELYRACSRSDLDKSRNEVERWKALFEDMERQRNMLIDGMNKLTRQYVA